jgi:hypothetical protein
MRTLVLVLGPKARRNRPLVPIEEVRIPIRSYCYEILTQSGIRDLSFLLFLQESGTVFAAHQGMVTESKGFSYYRHQYRTDTLSQSPLISPTLRRLLFQTLPDPENASERTTAWGGSKG